MTLPLRYYKLLELRGLSLKELGMTEVALAKSDALKALTILQGGAAVCTGGGVVYLEFGKPPRLSAPYQWAAGRLPLESLSEYAVRSIDIARHFVANFPEPPEPAVGYRLYIVEASDLSKVEAEQADSQLGRYILGKLAKLRERNGN